MNHHLNTTTGNVHLLHHHFFMPQLNRHRRIWIYLPEGYQHTEKHYPVLYMQDGQNLFDTHTSAFGDWGVDKTLNKKKEEIIVVGIDNGSEHRVGEYSPWSRAKLGGGEGQQYAHFLANTLKPYIDTHFRTKPERASTGIGGSSMGGLISLYTGLLFPQIFSKLVVLSPSLWFNKQIFEWVAQRPKVVDSNICMIGSRTESYGMERDMVTMYGALRNAGYADEELSFLVRSRGKHNEKFWAKEFEVAYKILFKQRIKISN